MDSQCSKDYQLSSPPQAAPTMLPALSYAYVAAAQWKLNWSTEANFGDKMIIDKGLRLAECFREKHNQQYPANLEIPDSHTTEKPPFRRSSDPRNSMCRTC